MKINLTEKKERQLKSFCTNILLATTANICTVATIVGKITERFPAAKFGRLHYRSLKRCKTVPLSKHRGNYNTKASLEDEAKHNLI